MRFPWQQPDAHDQNRLLELLELLEQQDGKSPPDGDKSVHSQHVPRIVELVDSGFGRLVR